MERTKRSNSADNFLKKKNAKYLKESINYLLNNIKVEKYTKEDIAFIIIHFLSKNNFKKLNQTNIIKYITNPKSFPSLTALINLKVEIKNELKNTELFEIKKNKVKLLYEKCLNYLTLNYERNSATKSTDSIKTNHANVLDFPYFKSDVEYGSCENGLNMNFVNDITNGLTFRERSQIKMSKERKPNLNSLSGENAKNINNDFEIEELANKIIGKFVPQYEIVFDKNKNFQNIMEVVSEFFINFQKDNNDEEKIRRLDKRIKKLNKLYTGLNTEIEPFNKLSEHFNELKSEIFNCNDIIKRQLMLIKLIYDNLDVFSLDIYKGEKKLFFSCQDSLKKMINELQNYYVKVKKIENTINYIILLFKNELNRIVEELELTEKDGKFFNLIKDINNTESLPINVNMDDILKLFRAYITQYNNSFSQIEKSKKRSEK